MVNWNNSKEVKAYMKEYDLKRNSKPSRVKYKKEYNQLSKTKKKIEIFPLFLT